ncbi:MAG TPA: CCA tRNA nucleotidyltransferase [Candidatus Brocadiia bacterium]|nr:CCA tRNA nucleotidyltransferase [Candidatus Brocadiia bacterium]
MSELRDKATGIVRRLRQAGHEAYFVGGCVRDEAMGLAPLDYDVATGAAPEQIQRLFERTAAVGAAFGVILVMDGDATFEVATFRSDGVYHDGRRPESVRYGSAREDVERRDFTINGMLYDPIDNRRLDWVGGMADIAARQVRAIGDPERRFREDRLRMLRAVRFAARFAYALEEKTYDALCRLAPGLVAISAERIGEELVRILTGPNAGRAVRLMRDTGLLKVILPEVNALAGVDQPPQFHPEGDVFEHTCLMLDALKDPSPELALAALLHDIGKPPTFAVADRIRFDEHDSVGAFMARAVCRRLKYSNERTDRVVDLTQHHMRFGMAPKMKESTLRRFMALPGFAEHLELHRLDCLASHGKLDNYEYVRQKLASLPPEQVSPPPLLNGHDLIAMGYKPGPKFRPMLDSVMDMQLEGKLTSREEAAAYVAREFPLEGAKPKD